MGFGCWVFSSNPLQNVEKSFTLTRGDRDLLLKKDTDLQVNALSSLVSHPRGFISMHQKCIVLPLFLMLSSKEKESQVFVFVSWVVMVFCYTSATMMKLEALHMCPVSHC
jgi:hypothetical protein